MAGNAGLGKVGLLAARFLSPLAGIRAHICVAACHDGLSIFPLVLLPRRQHIALGQPVHGRPSPCHLSPGLCHHAFCIQNNNASVSQKWAM